MKSVYLLVWLAVATWTLTCSAEPPERRFDFVSQFDAGGVLVKKLHVLQSIDAKGTNTRRTVLATHDGTMRVTSEWVDGLADRLLVTDRAGALQKQRICTEPVASTKPSPWPGNREKFISAYSKHLTEDQFAAVETVESTETEERHVVSRREPDGRLKEVQRFTAPLESRELRPFLRAP